MSPGLRLTKFHLIKEESRVTIETEVARLTVVSKGMLSDNLLRMLHCLRLE